MAKKNNKANNKQKNKKGKSQEASGTQTPQPEPAAHDTQPEEQQEQQQQYEQEQPQVEAAVESQPAAPESISETAAEPALEPESVPTQESELEQPPAVVEEHSTVPETEAQAQPPVSDESWSDQPAISELAPSQEPDVNDVQNSPEQPQEPAWEAIGSPETPVIETEGTHEDSQSLAEPSGTAAPTEENPVTAPQTPLEPTFIPTSAEPLESPERTEDQFVAAPAYADAADSAGDLHNPVMSGSFSEAELAQPIPESDSLPKQTTPPASKPASPIPQAASPIPPAASPSFKPVSPAPQSAAATPRALSPHPQSAPPVQQYTSPMAETMMPEDELAVLAQQDAFPTPPAESPVFQPTSPMAQATSPEHRTASPVAKTISPVQKHISPVAKPASPVPKVSSPLARGHMSPVMSPQSAPPPMGQRVPLQAMPPYPPSYHSPMMSANGYLPQYAYYQPSPNVHPTPRGSIDPGSAASFQMLRDLGFANGHGLNGKGGTISPPEHEEPIELLQRIQDAIPDIGRLLSSYKNTKGKLQAREAEFKQMETQHEQALMHKDFYIEALQNQMRKTANESAEESTRLKNTINELRMELGNLDEKQKDLEEKLLEFENSNKELTQSKAELEDKVESLDSSLKEAYETYERDMDKAKEEKAEALATQKQELTELFEEIKAEDEKAAAEALAARERELLDQQEAMKNDYENQKQQMQEAHDALQADFDSKVTELTSTKEELETRTTELADKQKELEDTCERHAQELDAAHQAHASEVESLNNSHAEEVAEMKKDFADQQQQWADEKSSLEQQIAEKTETIENLERENKRLEEDVAVKEKQLQHSVENMRLTIDNLDKDCDRLRKTLHSLGEATDLKSTKGDSFFLDCFGQLSRLIVSLSKEHFSYLPIDPPKDILSKLPPELPSFLDNTPASRELRSAYVQHVVSKTLTYRIFHPFLFTLGRRYDKADTFFQMLSMDIRRKSVRREAFWRQQTLKAAYTTSDAKQSINVVAAVIVDEIIDQLKHFADPRNLDALLVGVRKIVKLAAETWRLARVERELILASLPAPDADIVPNDDWEEYGTPKEGTLSSKEDPTRHVILRTFPRITREAAHEDFIGEEEKSHPCTYSQGCVLYSDSPVVMARLQELAKKSTDALASGDESPRRGSRDSIHREGDVPSSKKSKRSREEINGAPVDITA
ncbi:hypothetical protein BP00DRAFT_356793 [Aspergillus indologenus CBS 114.80]|uniref:RNA polymerase Rpb1 C-terminal repeat domain-containing protein n=1 Tax=Aspergillus indologenus CBS 114.80 TaxID=1450541 RepID=A0A2V5HNY2_9EURO|nr:hypothetical protein BP00DRAFT_356793 [Aspergillus indologenus CBS 114.80]